MTGARSLARAAAFARRTSAPLRRPRSVFLRLSGRPPSFTPLALAAASAALVRSDMARRSSSATMAIMPTVSRLAFGMSAAVNAMPERCSPRRKCASRARRSSFAMTSVALRTRHAASARASSGRSARLPLSTSTNSAIGSEPKPARYDATAARWASIPSPERPCLSVETRRYETKLP